MKKIIGICFILTTVTLNAQHSHRYSEQDSLRGSITPEREWWDLLHYNLSVNVNIDKKNIVGSNTIRFKTIRSNKIMQIDLQEPLKIESVEYHGNKLSWTSKGKAHFIEFIKALEIDAIDSITIHYSGVPHVAKHAPWDGGFTWTKDKNGKPFVATSNQGIGASLWWPCKDHGYDEPEEGIDMHITVPKGLSAVCNGRLVNQMKNKKESTFSWKVINPINNYGVNINIGDYVHIHDTLNGEKGTLDLDYFVLSYNKAIAQSHFQQAKKMLRAFEHWFGPYPFYEDSYKLVEVPYLGMEHQSSITYGNLYQNGYLGRDRANTGYMDKFDYIIIHESGHEWFANNITCKDNADLWIHESFTTYSEALFVEYYYGKEAGQHYLRKQRAEISNRKALIADYDVNAAPPADIYFKGTNVINTLRTINNDDSTWHSLLRDINSEFYHSTVSTAEIENYIANKLSLDLSKFFDQYLRDSKVPSLQVTITNNETLRLEWRNCIEGFNMPIRFLVNGKEVTWDNNGAKEVDLNIGQNITNISFDKNYYVDYKFDKTNPVFKFHQID